MAPSASAPATATTPFSVKSPFDSPDLADLVLRSCDGADFYVSKTVLVIASPIFRDMAALSSPPSSATECGQEDEMKDGKPIIVMHESTAKVLDMLLRILYPGQPAIAPKLAFLLKVLSTAEKYGMDCIMPWANQVLRAAIKDANTMQRPEAESTLAYLIGCKYGLPDVVEEAVLVSLKHPLSSIYSPNMDQCMLSAVPLSRLIDLRARLVSEIARIAFPKHLEGTENYTDLELLYHCPDACGGYYFSKAAYRRPAEKFGKASYWERLRKAILLRLRDSRNGPLSEAVLSEKILADVLSEMTCKKCCDRIKTGTLTSSLRDIMKSVIEEELDELVEDVIK